VPVRHELELAQAEHRVRGAVSGFEFHPTGSIRWPTTWMPLLLTWFYQSAA
jgi:hypothetical protein